MPRRLRWLLVLVVLAGVAWLSMPWLERNLPAKASGALIALRDAITPDPPDPVAPEGADVVVVGDSLVRRMPGLGEVNLGVFGDTVSDVRDRLPAIVARRPARVVLLMGTNDLLRGADAADVATEYGRALEAVPGTIDLTVMGVPPMRDDEQRRIPEPAAILELNERLAELARRRGARYVELRPPLVDAEDRLRSEFTEDGIHLNSAGYAAISALVSDALQR